ncbi:MAG: hypothetical protein AABZ12_05915 [Planctomycetota bacterium]
MTDAETSKPLLLLHAGALGDCVLAIHFARAVKAAVGAERVVLAARSPIARWAAKRGLIDDCRDLDVIGMRHFFLDQPDPPEDVLAFFRGFGWIVSLLGGPDELIHRNLRAITGQAFFCIDPRPAERSATAPAHITRQWVDRLALPMGTDCASAVT